MLMREIPRSTLVLEHAHGSKASIHKLNPMMGSEVFARRSMLQMSLFLPTAEDRSVMNLQVIERLRRKRPRKMSGRQPYFRELMLEVKAVSRGAPHSSQALTEKIMAQHVKLFNALSPSDKPGLGHDGRRPLAQARSEHRAGFAARCGHDQLSQIEVLEQSTLSLA